MERDMDRRTFAGSLAGVVAAGSLSQAAGRQATPEAPIVDPLVRYVEEVLEAGNTDVIPELVAEDIVIADSSIVGIESFTFRAIEIYARRMRLYDSIAYEVISSARQMPWTFAYVRGSGSYAESGDTFDVPILLAAKLQDNRITMLVHIAGSADDNP
ncbi:MAG: hypothetical protein H0T72_13765 [Chloroflexia bacterium]|nr:hypothetical protein [Chloroflexia bacterium]